MTPLENPDPSSIVTSFPAWARVLFWLGAPTVASGYLIYSLSTGVEAKLQDIQEAQRAHIAATITSDQRDEDYRQLTKDQLAAVIRLLQANCLNEAKNDQVAYNRCMAAISGGK